jgi:hypothetical protein
MSKSRLRAIFGRPVGAITVTLFVVAACSNPTLRSPEIYLNSYAVNAPNLQRLFVCHGYECRLKTAVALGEHELNQIRDLMAPGQAGPAAERAAIATTIAWLEDRVAPIAGTAADRDYRDLLSGSDPAQLDCIDEAANSTSYMMVIRDLGLLKYHTLGHPISKGFLLDGRYPHVTAVLLENETGEPYAIDSWIFANGEEPMVMTLKDWKDTSSEEMYRSRYPNGV